MKGHNWSLVVWVTLGKMWFSPHRHILAGFMDCVTSDREKAAMEDQENVNRAGPMRTQSVSSIQVKNFHST